MFATADNNQWTVMGLQTCGELFCMRYPYPTTRAPSLTQGLKQRTAFQIPVGATGVTRSRINCESRIKSS